MRANDWADPVWRASAHAWITARLTALGTPVTGPIEEVRARPWSVTHRAPTDAGWRWFKANTIDCRYEAALAEALGRWAPDAVLVPLAVDAAKGWLLSADAGPTLRDTIDAERAAADADAADRERTLRRWSDMLRDYARLQRRLAPRVDELVALGVPDQRWWLLPPLLENLLADREVRAGLGPERLSAVEAARPAFAEACEELARDGIPASLQHDDLTDANVFVTGGHRFFDWGDSGVAHPFGSLLVALSFAGHVLRLEPGAPELGRLRDAYLGEWTDLGDLDRLRRSATLACRVTRLSRALSWRRALRDAAVPVADDFRTAVADWLAELSEPDPI